MNSWTTTVDRSASDVPTAAEWNSYLGANGNLDFLFARNWLLQGVDSTERQTSSTTAVDLCTISGLNILIAQPILVVGAWRKEALAATTATLGIKVNSTTVVDASSGAGQLGITSATNQAEDGSFLWYIAPRNGAGYIASVIAIYQTRVSSTGAVARAASFGPDTNPWAAVFPTATITSLTIRGLNAGSSVNLSVKDVAVYAGGITL